MDTIHYENGDSEFKIYIPVTIRVGAEDTNGTSSVEVEVLKEIMRFAIDKNGDKKYYVSNMLYKISDLFETKTDAVKWIINEAKGIKDD